MWIIIIYRILWIEVEEGYEFEIEIKNIKNLLLNRERSVIYLYNIFRNLD